MKSHITSKLGVVLELLIFPIAGLISTIFLEIIWGWETHKLTCWSGLLTYFCRTVSSNQSNHFPLLFFWGGWLGCIIGIKLLCVSFLLILVKLLIWRRQWHPTPVLLPGKSHGQRSLVGCSPRGHKESDMTERLHFHFSLSCIGEGNSNPLQCSCLENPRDRGAWCLLSMGSHRVGHDWSDLAAAANC